MISIGRCLSQNIKQIFILSDFNGSMSPLRINVILGCFTANRYFFTILLLIYRRTINIKQNVLIGDF